MKKVLSLILVGAMVLGLVACGGAAGSKTFGSTDANAEKIIMCTNAEFPPKILL